MSVHYFQLLVMCNNYLLETFCDITLVVVCVGDLAIALVMRNMPTSQQLHYVVVIEVILTTNK